MLCQLKPFDACQLRLKFLCLSRVAGDRCRWHGAMPHAMERSATGSLHPPPAALDASLARGPSLDVLLDDEDDAPPPPAGAIPSATLGSPVAPSKQPSARQSLESTLPHPLGHAPRPAPPRGNPFGDMGGDAAGVPPVDARTPAPSTSVRPGLVCARCSHVRSRRRGRRPPSAAAAAVLHIVGI